MTAVENRGKLWLLMAGIEGNDPTIAFMSKNSAEEFMEVFVKAAPAIPAKLLEIPLWD